MKLGDKYLRLADSFKKKLDRIELEYSMTPDMRISAAKRFKALLAINDQEGLKLLRNAVHKLGEPYDMAGIYELAVALTLQNESI